MPINVPKCGISYFPIPKVACSSFKHFFFEINNGFSFSDFKKQSNFTGGIHLLPDYKSRRGNLESYADVVPSFRRMYIIRDPFKRLFSAYKDKILGKSYITSESLKVLGEIELDEQPSFGKFLENLNGYMQASGMLKSHIQSAKLFLPPKISSDDIVLRLEDKDRVANYCQSLSANVALRKINASKKHTIDRKLYEFDEKQFGLGLDYLEKDYSFLSQYYVAPSYEQARESLK